MLQELLNFNNACVHMGNPLYFDMVITHVFNYNSFAIMGEISVTINTEYNLSKLLVKISASLCL